MSYSELLIGIDCSLKMILPVKFFYLQNSFLIGFQAFVNNFLIELFCQILAFISSCTYCIGALDLNT